MSLLHSLCRRHRAIPRIIHQVWHDGAVPSVFDGFCEAWLGLHPAWDYELWDFSRGTNLLAVEYPDLLPVFYSLPKTIQRADLLRYVILHHHGGVYADLDTEPIRPFDELVSSADFIAGYEAKTYPSICNAILCSVPHHPTLTATLRYLTQVVDRTQTDDPAHVFATTGSLALTPIILANATSRTRILPTGAFYPFSWDEKHRCKESFPGSYARHYWVSGWYRDGKYQLEPYWNQSELTQGEELSSDPYGMA